MRHTIYSSFHSFYCQLHTYTARLLEVAKTLLSSALLCSLFSCLHDSPLPPSSWSSQWQIGQAAPTFSVFTQDGRIIHTNDMKGTVGVIVFFNTKCKDCQHFLPTLEKLYRKQQLGKLASSTPFTLLPISRAQNDQEIATYWKQNQFAMPYAAQETRKLYELFARSGIPRVYIITPDGIAFQDFDDKNPPSLSTLEKAIELAAQKTS